MTLTLWEDAILAICELLFFFFMSVEHIWVCIMIGLAFLVGRVRYTLVIRERRRQNRVARRGNVRPTPPLRSLSELALLAAELPNTAD